MGISPCPLGFPGAGKTLQQKAGDGLSPAFEMILGWADTHPTLFLKIIFIPHIFSPRIPLINFLYKLIFKYFATPEYIIYKCLLIFSVIYIIKNIVYEIYSKQLFSILKRNIYTSYRLIISSSSLTGCEFDLSAKFVYNYSEVRSL